MTPKVPNIDPPDGSSRVLRTRWFPFAMMHESLFRVVLLLAAAHNHSVQPCSNIQVDRLRLKEEAIRSINRSLPDPPREASDWLIAAVAKMASYEAMFGDRETYRIHMEGVVQLINTRGGLEALEANRVVQRMVIYIDLLAGARFNLPRFFPNAESPWKSAREASVKNSYR